MNKKLRTSVFILLGVLIFIFVLAGCGKPVPAPTPKPEPDPDPGLVPSVANATYVSTRFSNEAVEGESLLAKERGELLAFVNQEQTDLTKLAKYDDNFFKANVLVIFKIVEENLDNESVIASYTVDNDAITINVKTNKQGKDGTSAHYYFILKLTKDIGDGITKIKVLKNGELLANKFTEEEYDNFVAQFDLTEEKVIGKFSADSEFANDTILIVMKKTTTYPEFKVEYLGIDEAIGFRYLMKRPSDQAFEEGDEDYLNRYRQIIAIDLTPQTKERIIELIKEIEKLDFVRSAEPNYLMYFD